MPNPLDTPKFPKYFRRNQFWVCLEILDAQPNCWVLLGIHTSSWSKSTYNTSSIYVQYANDSPAQANGFYKYPYNLLVVSRLVRKDNSNDEDGCEHDDLREESPKTPFGVLHLGLEIPRLSIELAEMVHV